MFLSLCLYIRNFLRDQKSFINLLYSPVSTAPCAPEILSLTQINPSGVRVSWTAPNRQANYTVRAVGSAGTLTCWSSGTSCDISSLPCGARYEVSAYATSIAGQSLPSYSASLETGTVIQTEEEKRSMQMPKILQTD